MNINPDWITPLMVLVVFLWLRSDLRRIEDDVKRSVAKVGDLSDDHNALARELSEVKGYMRGTLPESSGRGPTAHQQA